MPVRVRHKNESAPQWAPERHATQHWLSRGTRSSAAGSGVSRTASATIRSYGCRAGRISRTREKKVYSRVFRVSRWRLQLEHRADAHILIAFLAYCLQVTLKQRLLLHAPGLTPTAVLEKLAEIKMIDVWIPTVDQRWLILPRHTQPSPEIKLLIEKLKLQLPSQPPPRLVGQKQGYEIELRTVR